MAIQKVLKGNNRSLQKKSKVPLSPARYKISIEQQIKNWPQSAIFTVLLTRRVKK